MDFKTHNEQRIEVNGTCLQGYISAKLQQLKDVFGEPEATWGDKTTAEWYIKFADGTVATIYDWKQDVTPGLHEVYQWHIGGRNRNAVARVHEAFRTKLGLGAIPLAASQH